jgi:RimJ/RimL family protein N-acetyltransferase
MGAELRDLRTPRLRLRAPTDTDIEAIARLSSDPRVNQHSPTGAPSLEVARTSARRFVEDWRRDGISFWVIEHQDQLIGLAGVKAARLHGQAVWNLYYRFAPEAWGQGFAREAAQASITIARKLAPERIVVVRTRPTNEPAARLARAIGMIRAESLDSDGFITFVTAEQQPPTAAGASPQEPVAERRT